MPNPSPVRFEMTKCPQCGVQILAALNVCPSCGRQQTRFGRGLPYQPGTLLAIILSLAVIFAFSWMKPSSPPHTGQGNSPPSAIGTR